MPKVAVSLLSADFYNLQNELKKVEEGGADYLHLDIMDGHFVPNITFGPLLIEKLRPHTKLFFDVHLMLSEPERQILPFIKAGADLITVHAEACSHLHALLKYIKAGGVKTGVALNPATPLDFISYVLEDLDQVLIMSVNPGWGGQEYLPLAEKKIRTLKRLKKRKNLTFDIAVDGGINNLTAPKVIAAGADILVAGSYIFNGSNPPQEMISILKNQQSKNILKED